MYDTQAVGLLALNGALLAAAIAAKDFLGHLWWLALIGFLFSSVICAVSLSRGGGKAGPEIDTLLDQAATSNADAMDELVAKGIRNAWNENNRELQVKPKLIGLALALIGLTIFAAIFSVLVF